MSSTPSFESIEPDQLPHLLENNRKWAEEIVRADPGFFRTLSAQQAPEYLWIGCADSRVPANEIVGLLPGELFVHRNVANLVVHTDLNMLSVLQFAVDVLKVRHVIVCGHYGCAGVTAAYRGSKYGLVDNWLRHLQDLLPRYVDGLESLPGEGERLDRFSELNVLEQVVNVSRTSVIGEAWDSGQRVLIHGWIYGLRDGRLRDLGVTVGPGDAVVEIRDRVAGRLLSKS